MNPLRAWDAFWFRPVSARPLAAFRVVLGVLTLCHLGFISVEFDHWLTGRGLLQGSEARELAGPLRPSVLQYVQDPASVRVFVLATAALAVLVTVGWRTRVTSALLWLAALMIHHRMIPTNCGPDNLLVLLLFYLMLSPSGAAYSLDARRESRRRGTQAEPLIVPWAQRLLQLHISLIYFDTAMLKCAGSTWLGGTALHFVLHNREVGRFDLSALAQYPVLISVMTLAALLSEFALAFLLWSRAARPWIILTGLGLHGVVLLVVNVPLFGELMTASYLTFLTAGELDAVLGVLDLRRRLGRPIVERRGVVPGRVDPAETLRGPHEPAPALDTPDAVEWLTADGGSPMTDGG